MTTEKIKNALNCFLLPIKKRVIKGGKKIPIPNIMELFKAKVDGEILNSFMTGT